MKALHSWLANTSHGQDEYLKPQEKEKNLSCLFSLLTFCFLFTQRLFDPFPTFLAFLYRKSLLSCWVFGPFKLSFSATITYICNISTTNTHMCKTLMCMNFAFCYSPKYLLNTLQIATHCSWHQMSSRRSVEVLPFLKLASSRCLQTWVPTYFRVSILSQLTDILWLGFHPHWIFLYDLF